MSIYANGLNIQMNEIAFLQFMENTQGFNGPVACIVVQYEVLKQMHGVIGQVIEQHDKKLNELQRTKANMN